MCEHENACSRAQWNRLGPNPHSVISNQKAFIPMPQRTEYGKCCPPQLACYDKSQNGDNDLSEWKKKSPNSPNRQQKRGLSSKRARKAKGKTINSRGHEADEAHRHDGSQNRAQGKERSRGRPQLF